jgi:hypothetical protein
MAKATGRDTTSPTRRDEILERDKYTCRGCGAEGPGAGGTARLHVHHADPEPDDGDRHDPANLVTLCADCHAWLHRRPDADDVPFDLTDADVEKLRPHDYEILQVLAEDGPLSTGEIQERISVDVSSLTVRERLWLLMGLDYEVPERDAPLVDQSVKTGAWGLRSQIEESERGRIPEDMQSLIRRVNDEQVRRALNRGCDRETVTEVFDIAERTSWHKQRRAQAYDFPLSALERGGSPESSRDRGDAAGDDVDDAVDTTVAADPQQQLDAVADGGDDDADGIGGDDPEELGESTAGRDGGVLGEESVAWSDVDPEVRQVLQALIQHLDSNG